MTAHLAVPCTGTEVTIDGPRHLRPLDTGHPNCWPAEGLCAGCDEVIRREALEKPWKHTGRRPGEAG